MKETDGVMRFSEDEYKRLSASAQGKHINRVIRDMLKNSKNGLTVPQIHKLTQHSKDAIEKHLTELVATNFAYKVTFGRTNVYYANGKTLHSFLEKDMSLGDKHFSFHFIKNPSGEFIYIQEKKKDSIGALSPSGGLLIKEDLFPLFINLLQDVNNELLNFKTSVNGGI